MLQCLNCKRPLPQPQFECSRCKGDFCAACAEEARKCRACAKELSRFKTPETTVRSFVPGSGS